VVWTDEIAEAFRLCKTVLDAGDEIGARMAFKEAYKRLVLAARTHNLPVKWTASIGWDKQAAQLVLEKAVRSGQVAIENLPILLPAPISGESDNEKIRANLKQLKEVLAGLVPASEKLRRQREKTVQEEQEATALTKRQANARVIQYMAGQQVSE
jgi:hypothetical protein